MAPAVRNVSGVSESEKRKLCKWRDCSTNVDFKSIEEVLEHVLQEHIPKVVKDEDGEDEVVCEWDVCEMGTIRGDLEKKTAWMKNHFKTRHAKNAKTFKCLFDGCKEVRATSQEIETHVRLTHFIKKKSESASTSKEPSATPQPEEAEPQEQGEVKLQKVWKIENGKLSWVKPPKVTKRTIVYYEDGPRYVYPSGRGRGDYDSNESELASDEYWSSVHYSDDEETLRKSWRPSAIYHPVYNPGPSWYDPKNPPVTDSEEEARRRRPRRVKRKKPNRVAKKKERLSSLIDKITKNVGKTKEEIEREKEPGWVGSFWYQFLEMQKAQKAQQQLQQQQHEAALKIEQREISEPPELFEEPIVSPKRTKMPQKMPILTAHYEDEQPADSEPDDAVSDVEEERSRKVRVLKRTLRKTVKFEEPQKSLKSLRQPVEKRTESPRKHAKKMKKRPVRACRPRYSFYEMDDCLEVEFESPECSDTEPTPSPKRSSRLRRFESPEKKPESLKSSICSKRPKTLEKPERRPKRACRVLGSMEEVPFFMEIGVDFGNEKSPRIKKPKIIEEVGH